jgi:CrcB protein
MGFSAGRIGLGGAVDKAVLPAERGGMFRTMLEVALGGALGASARFATYAVFSRADGQGFLWATVIVNVLGSFLMGVLVIWLQEKGLTRHAPILLTGVLGGFTTFSAFSLDAMKLWEQGSGGLALAYVVGSVAASITALALGMSLDRGWFA